MHDLFTVIFVYYDDFIRLATGSSNFLESRPSCSPVHNAFAFLLVYPETDLRYYIAILQLIRNLGLHKGNIMTNILTE